MKPLYTGSEWSMKLIDTLWKHIDDIGKNTFGLDYYEPQIEIISSEQMLDAYSSVAMPVMYNHWSFGKTFLQNERAYNKGIQGLAYEVVINTDPCIAYLMENNSATMQALVLAHASCGHSHFFKNNYLFKDWTEADSIVDYLKFAKNYIRKCEEQHGEAEVESILDACHSLQNHGIDKYKRPKITAELKRQKQKMWDEYFESTFNDLWRTVPKKARTYPQGPEKTDVPEENVLYFLEKNSPVLASWEKEIVRIVRKISQYFYPQRQTQLMNEGFATFTHHMIMTEMHEQGLITDGSYLEFLASHSNVVTQLDWDHPRNSGINVYALGFAMFSDIKRICQNPDEEDKRWFPEICGTDWLETIKDIVENYRDESFVLQFLSPKVIRHFKMFSVNAKQGTGYLKVSGTHDDESLKLIRETLAERYDLSRSIPQIEVANVDWTGDRTLTLEYTASNGQLLNYTDAKKTMCHVQSLWGQGLELVYKDADGNILDEV